MNVKKYEELIIEGQSFIGKNITSSNPQFKSWNNKLIRFIEKSFGKESTTTKNFKDRSYSLHFYTFNTPVSAWVEALEEDLKTSLADLKELKKEAENGELEDLLLKAKQEKDVEKTMVNVNINNSNINNNSISMNLSIEEIKEVIEENSMIGEKEKEELLQKLDEIKDLQNSSKNKNEKWKIAKNILKFVVDKGADIAIMYIPQILKAILQ